jgi:hypothetical protein
MSILQKKLETEDKINLISSRSKMKKDFPSCIRRTLRFYTEQAINYYQLENKNPTIIFRGQHADWKEKMNNAKLKKVRVKAIHIQLKLDEI